MLTPNQFAVNEVWIIAKLIDCPMVVQEGPYDVFVLMDAASTYVIGRSLTAKSGTVPSVSDVETGFRIALELAHQRRPAKVLIDGSIAAGNSFEQVARQKGIHTERVEPTELATILQPLRDSFVRYFQGSMGV